jgi:hypothetical protein
MYLIKQNKKAQILPDFEKQLSFEFGDYQCANLENL